MECAALATIWRPVFAAEPICCCQGRRQASELKNAKISKNVKWNKLIQNCKIVKYGNDKALYWSRRNEEGSFAVSCNWFMAHNNKCKHKTRNIINNRKLKLITFSLKIFPGTFIRHCSGFAFPSHRIYGDWLRLFTCQKTSAVLQFYF